VTAVSTVKPRFIDDEEHERLHERVAAIDKVAASPPLILSGAPQG
jgi:hypothetical protein